MLDYTDLKFRYKVVLLGILIPIFLGSVFLFFFYRYSFDEMVRSGVSRARAVCDAAENLSETQSPNLVYKSSDSNKPSGHDFMMSPTESSSVIVPDICQKKTSIDSERYELNIIRLPSKGNERKFDKFQTYGLEMIQLRDFDEYYNIDSDDTLRYMRPIKVSQKCLSCHGDLGSSKKLWVDSHGEMKKNKTELAGWKDGQICGAFEVVESLAEQKKQLAGVISSAGIVLVTGLTVYAVLFMVLVMWIINWFDVPGEISDDPGDDTGEIIEDGEMEEHEFEEQTKIRC